MYNLLHNISRKCCAKQIYAKDEKQQAPGEPLEILHTHTHRVIHTQTNRLLFNNVLVNHIYVEFGFQLLANGELKHNGGGGGGGGGML